MMCGTMEISHKAFCRKIIVKAAILHIQMFVLPKCVCGWKLLAPISWEFPGSENEKLNGML